MVYLFRLVYNLTVRVNISGIVLSVITLSVVVLSVIMCHYICPMCVVIVTLAFKARLFATSILV